MAFAPSSHRPVDVPLVGVELDLRTSEIGWRVAGDLGVRAVVGQVRSGQEDVDLPFLDRPVADVHPLSRHLLHGDVMHVGVSDDVGLEVGSDVDRGLQLRVLEATPRLSVVGVQRVALRSHLDQ